MIEIKTRRTKFVDIDLNFKPHPITKDVARRIDENAIVTSLRNLIMTEKFDHHFHPEIYSPVRKLLFELLTNETLSNITRSIEYLISNFEPRVELIRVDVVPYANQNGIEIFLYYKIVGTIETLKTTFYLDRVL
jgi:phage baseplate assembly protein W